MTNITYPHMSTTFNWFEHTEDDMRRRYAVFIKDDLHDAIKWYASVCEWSRGEGYAARPVKITDPYQKLPAGMLNHILRVYPNVFSEENRIKYE